MRKILAVLAISSIIVACDDDKEVDVLVGKWMPSQISINNENIPYDGHTSCGNDYLQLNEFNSFEIVNYYESDIQPHSTPESPCSSEKYYGSYNVINNELKFFGSNFFQGGTIIEKSNTTLKLKRLIDVEGDGNDDEVIESFVKI